MSTIFVIEDELLANRIKEIVNNFVDADSDAGESLNKIARDVYNTLPITIRRKVDNIEEMKRFKATCSNSLFSVDFKLRYGEDFVESVAADSFTYRWNNGGLKETLPEFIVDSINDMMDKYHPDVVFSQCLDVDGGFLKEVMDKVRVISYEFERLRGWSGLAGTVKQHFPDLSDDECVEVVDHILYSDDWR